MTAEVECTCTILLIYQWQFLDNRTELRSEKTNCQIVIMHFVFSVVRKLLALNFINSLLFIILNCSRMCFNAVIIGAFSQVTFQNFNQPEVYKCYHFALCSNRIAACTGLTQDNA